MSEIKRPRGEPKDDATPRAQQETEARPEADLQEDGLRQVHTGLGFWKFCPHKRCRRARACSGDVEDCSLRFWPLVPEQVKAMIRAYTTAVVDDGRPRLEAARHAAQEVARWRAWEARLAQDQEDRAKAAARFAPPQPRTVPDDRAPRVRSL